MLMDTPPRRGQRTPKVLTSPQPNTSAWPLVAIESDSPKGVAFQRRLLRLG